MGFLPPATRISLVSPSNANILLSITPGWYFIQIITAISMSRLREIESVTNITFTTRNLVYSGCYSFYLIEKQLTILQQYPELFIYPHQQDIHRTNKKIQSDKETGRCKVKSIPKWKPNNPNIRFNSWAPDIFIVNSTCSSLLPDHRIEYLVPYTGRKLRNRYNSGFIQSGSQEGVIEDGSLVSPHPIFNIGIHGENQLVSIIDTGVDYNHAFFFDPNNNIEINKTMENHRKIAKYYNFANPNDGSNGHGTHCAGILTGESYINNSGLILYSGMAPKARLVVADVGFTGSDLNGEFDQFELFNLFDKDGVSICSNSWGFDANEDAKLDTLMYDYIGFLHPHMLLVFAAGNEARSPPYFYTINSPGDSKNLLSVGGLTPTRLQNIESTNQWNIEINCQRYLLQQSSKGRNPIKTTRGNPMQKLANLTIIDVTDQSEIPQYDNKIVFLDDKDDPKMFCSIFQCINDPKCTIIPPAAIIHRNNNYIDCKAVEFPCPIFELSNDVNDTIRDQIKLATEASIFEYSGNPGYQMNLAPYSSKGPSPIGLCKPDIVVPGTAFSSSALKKQTTTEALSTKSGTSMATPAAAGSCVLIRQFFVDGYYPSRKKDEKKSFIPSSFLIKAVIINSASPFKSSNYGPNIETGFGSPDLSSSLLEPLRIVKNESIQSNEKHKYFINLNEKNNSLRVTLGYVDPPLAITSTMPLFADLDLLIISPSGKVYIGNERPNRQTEMSNTIERVIVKKEDIEIGQYTILVLSNNFSDPDVESIRYSLVINGPFDHYDFEANKEDLDVDREDKKCEFECLNNGKCDEKRGICTCDDNHAGFDCSIEFINKNINESNHITIAPNENKYFKFHVGFIKNRTNISFSVNLNTDDRYASLLAYASDMKFSSISDANIIPMQIKSRTSPTINLTVMPNENETTDFNFYLALRIVCTSSFDVDFVVNHFEYPVSPNEIEESNETEIFYESESISEEPKIETTEPQTQFVTQQNPQSSFQSEVQIPHSSQPEEEESESQDVHSIILPLPPSSSSSSSSLPSSSPSPSSTLPSPSSSSLYPASMIATSEPDSINLVNQPTRTASIKGLANITFLLSCSVVALVVVLAVFLIVLFIQIRRKNEIDQFYSREEEPKLTIMEKDVEP